MLLETVREEATLSGGGESAAFTVKTSSKIFDMLASGIYKDKYLAPLREIACNAFDAHVAAGKADVPIKVHLPVALEPWLAIRDYGVGLSYEDVMRMYTSYGESKKDTSNDFIGGFGLGSKSPFSYADSFSVTSWFNGKKSEYALYKDGTRAPTITHISTVDTTEGNGFEVHMPVQRGDITTFVQRAKDFFRFWPTKPETNVKLDYPVFTADRIIKFKVGELQIGKSKDWAEQAVIKAIMGNVAYDIDFRQLNSELGRKFQEYLEQHKFAFFTLPIGSLAVAISRETVSYEPQTIQFLQSLLDEWSANIVADIQKVVSNATTYMGALFSLNREYQAFRKFLNPNVSVMWQNETLKPLDAQFSLDNKKITIKLTSTHGDSWRLKDSWYSGSDWLFGLPEFQLNAGNTCRLVVDDVNGNKIWARYKQILLDYPNTDFYFVEGDLKYLLDLLRIDDKNVIYLSKVTPIIVKNPSRDKNAPVTIWKVNELFSGEDVLLDGKVVEEVSMPLSDLETLPGVFVHGYLTHNRRAYYKNTYKVIVYLNGGRAQGLSYACRQVLKYGQPVYLIPKRYSNRVDGNTNLKAAEQFVNDVLQSVTEQERSAYMARQVGMSAHPWQLAIPSYKKEFDEWKKLCDTITKVRELEIHKMLKAFPQQWESWAPKLMDFKKEFPLYDSIPENLLSEYVKLQKFWNDNHSTSSSTVNP